MTGLAILLLAAAIARADTITSYTTLDDPLANTSGIRVWGVSGNNVVGYYMDSSSVEHGFLYNGGTYTTLDNPSASQMTYYGTTAFGISGNNIVGTYSSDGASLGFLYNGSTYATLNNPSGTSTAAYGISGNNVVGSYTDSSNVIHGFLYNGTS